MRVHDLTSQLDAAPQAFDGTRQSNRVSCTPLKTTRSGITNLPKTKAQEYPAVLVLLVVLLGTEAKYVDTEETRKVQNALSATYVLWFVLKRTWFDKAEVQEKLPDTVKR